MIVVDIPGYKSIEIKNVVFDFNSTIAEDGILIDEIKEKIKELKYQKKVPGESRVISNKKGIL